MVVAIKSVFNNQFWRFRHEGDSYYGHILLSGEKVVDPYARFEVVNSTKHEGLFHIKCLYNNKFFVRTTPVNYWICALANKEDENLSSWTCTLFKRVDIIGESTSNKFRLMHVQLGLYAYPYLSCLFAGNTEFHKDPCEIFTFENLDIGFTVNKAVAFKGENGQYLGVLEKNGVPYLQFSYDNPNAPEVEHEIYTTPEGIIYIKSNYLEKFWRLGDDDWIVADAADPRGGNDIKAMFRPNLLNMNVIALLRMDRGWSYCKRFTSNGFESCLNAATATADEFSVLEVIDLEVEEP